MDRDDAEVKRGQPCIMCRNYKPNELFLLWDDFGRGYLTSRVSECPYCGRSLTENVVTKGEKKL